MKSQSSLLANKNFIFYFFAALIGVLGEGIFGLTAIVLVLEKTESIIEISKMMILTLLPSVILAPLVGVLIDSVNKVKLAFVCNLLRFLSIGIIPLSFYLGFYHPMVFYLSIFLSYIIWYVLEPAKESILKEILTPEQYKQGISLVQGAWQVGLLSSAIIAGLLMDHFGNIQSIFVSAFTYLLAGFLFVSIRTKTTEEANGQNELTIRTYMQDIIEGFNYLFHNKRALFFVLTSSMFLPFIYGINTLIAPFNYQILGGDGVSLGFIDSGAGIGSLISAALCSLLVGKKALIRTMLISIVLTAISITIFSVTTSVFLAFLLYLAVGLFIGNVKVLSRIFVFEYVDQKYIGRVMTAITLLSLSSSIAMTFIIAILAEKSIIIGYSAIGIFLILPFTFAVMGSRKIGRWQTGAVLPLPKG